MIETIKQSLLDIQTQYIQNATNSKFRWVGLSGKIELLYSIAKEIPRLDDKLLENIILVKVIINGTARLE